jgi:hypothetical protein
MDPLDIFWHVTNFFAPAALVGLLVPLLAKLLWRRALAEARWTHMSVWAVGGSAIALIAGLVLFGRDGKMATYGAMVLACAAGSWWAGFGPGRRR